MGQTLQELVTWTHLHTLQLRRHLRRDYRSAVAALLALSLRKLVSSCASCPSPCFSPMLPVPSSPSDICLLSASPGIPSSRVARSLLIPHLLLTSWASLQRLHFPQRPPSNFSPARPRRPSNMKARRSWPPGRGSRARSRRRQLGQISQARPSKRRQERSRAGSRGWSRQQRQQRQSRQRRQGRQQRRSKSRQQRRKSTKQWQSRQQELQQAGGP